MPLLIDKFQQFKEQHQFPLPKTKHVQRALLVATTACAILSLIPPLRLAGALALRGIALLTSGVNVMDSWKIEGIPGRVAQAAKIALVALGLIALATSSPILLIASVAADLALQIFELGKCLFEAESMTKALCHLAFIVIDTLLLAGLIVGSWELIVAALAVQAAAMGALALGMLFVASQNKNNVSYIDSLCFLTLTAVGIAGSITSAKLISDYFENPKFELKNDTKHQMVVYDKNKNVIATINPGKTARFELKDATYTYNHGWDRVNIVYYDKMGLPVATTTALGDPYLQQFPMEPKNFPTLPLGSLAIVLQNLRKLFHIRPASHPVALP